MSERVLIYRDAFDNIFKFPAIEYERMLHALTSKKFLYETEDANGAPVVLNLEHFVCMFVATVQSHEESWSDASSE